LYRYTWETTTAEGALITEEKTRKPSKRNFRSAARAVMAANRFGGFAKSHAADAANGNANANANANVNANAVDEGGDAGGSGGAVMYMLLNSADP
jgi:hypothetical protein